MSTKTSQLNMSANGAHPVTTEVVTVTPEMAAEWLSTNDKNRNLREMRVRLYAQEMKNGRWHITGEPIQFDVNGKLLNGQHRLNACVVAETPFTTVIVRGVTPDAMIVMDSGLGRTPSDALKFAGLDSSTDLASTAKVVISWQREIFNGRDASLISRQEQVGFTQENEEAMRVAISRGAQLYRSAKLSRAKWSAFMYQTARIDDDMAGLFASHFADPYGLSSSSEAPIIALHRWASHAQRRKLRPWEQIVGACKAWNAWVTGRQLSLVKVLPSEVEPPVLQG